MSFLKALIFPLCRLFSFEAASFAPFVHTGRYCWLSSVPLSTFEGRKLSIVPDVLCEGAERERSPRLIYQLGGNLTGGCLPETRSRGRRGRESCWSFWAASWLPCFTCGGGTEPHRFLHPEVGTLARFHYLIGSFPLSHRLPYPVIKGELGQETEIVLIRPPRNSFCSRADLGEGDLFAPACGVTAIVERELLLSFFFEDTFGSAAEDNQRGKRGERVVQRVVAGCLVLRNFCFCH